MKIRVFAFLCKIFLLFLALHQVSCCLEEENVTTVKPELCECPDTTLPGSLKDAETKVLLKILKNLCGWSNTANKLKVYLKEYLTCNNEAKRNWAAVTVFWMSPLNRYVDEKPVLCAYAQVINATVSCIKEGSSAGILKTLTTSYTNEEAPIGSFYDNLADIMININDVASGCVTEDQIQDKGIPESLCYKSGSVYQFSQVWSLLGCGIPPNVRNIIRQLYSSRLYSDRLLAATATHALAPLPQRYYKKWLSKGFLEFANLQYAPSVPSCCCGERKDKMRNLKYKYMDYKPIREEETLYYQKPSSCTKPPY